MSKKAETQPQSAYAALVRGFKSKLTYSIRSIPNNGELLSSLVQSDKIKHLTNSNIIQDPINTVNSSEVSKLKSKMKAEKEERYKNILKNLEESFTGLMIRKRDAH